MYRKCVLLFSLQLSSETFLILRTFEPGMMKLYVVLHVKCPLFLSDFNETWISRQIFKKYSHFHENPSSGRGVVPCGETDRQTDVHDEANRRFSQFCEKHLQIWTIKVLFIH